MASHVHPHEAHHVKKGQYIMLKDCPCKITKVKTSKTGKHGHAKCRISGNDIRDGKTKVEMKPGHMIMRAFDYQRTDIEVMNVQGNSIEYLDENYQEQSVEFSQKSSEKDGPLKSFLEEYNANADAGGDKEFIVTVVTCPVGKDGEEKTEVVVIEHKENKD